MREVDTRGVFEACPDGVAVIDVETGSISTVNDRFVRLCGRPRHALRQESLGALAPDTWRPPAEVETLIDEGASGHATFTWPVKSDDGTTTTLRCSLRVTPDTGPDGAVLTAREQPASGEGRERAIDRTARQRQQLIDGLNDPVFVVDFDGNYVDVNRMAVERLGYDRSELLSMGPTDLTPPDQAARVDDRLAELEDHETLVFESVQVTADGEEIPVEINARRITYGGDPAVLSIARNITDRKERERESRTFRRAVEQTGHAIYITDTDGTIEYVNPAFESVTGYDADDAVGRTPSILSTGDEDEEYYADLWETVLGGNVWEEEIENERADGERYYAEQTIAPILADGEVVKFVAIQRDVSERKEREYALDRYRQLVENIPVGVYRNTPGVAGEFEEVNPAMVEMFDAESEAALLETNVAELYRTPGQRELFSRKLERGGQVTEEELRLQTLDGDPFWGAVTAIRHEVDGDVYYDGIIQDVTERRQQARELRLREQRFRRLFEDHSAPMLLVDPDSGAIERANDAAAQFYGYERSTLTSMAIQDINQLDDEEVARRRKAADEGETNRFIFPHELANGEVRQVEIDSSPVHTGEERLLFSILHDVTDRERTRRRLERQNEQLELLNRVVRHDIRNDMTVVLGYAEVLADHVDDAGDEHLDSLLDHGEHVVELTKTARELMETMLGDGTEETRAVTLDHVLETEVRAVESSDETATITVDWPLPAVEVRGNEMLSSVFRNLLTNAVQHNDKAEPRVAVTATVEDGTAHVRIADNGPGVPDGQKTEIFGKGEHGLDSAGTGLGLYLVHTFVNQFGGDVWVTDNDPEGAVFHVTLPVVS